MIFDSLKTKNLNEVYEINLYQYHLHMHAEHMEGSVVEDTPHAVKIATPLKRPEFNVVLQTDLNDNFDDVAEETNEFFNNLEVPYTWYIGPHTKPNNIDNLLKNAGLRYIGDDQIIGVELDSESIRNISSPNSLYIEAIDTQEKLDKWVEVYCKVKNFKQGNTELMKRMFSIDKLLDNADTFRKYIGWLNGKPVGISTLIMSSGIAVSYDGIIIPKYRDWGIEESLRLVPLKESKTNGYKLGIAPVSIGDTKRFTRHGFTELFRFKKFVNMGRNRRRRRRRRRN